MGAATGPFSRLDTASLFRKVGAGVGLGSAISRRRKRGMVRRLIGLLALSAIGGCATAEGPAPGTVTVAPSVAGGSTSSSPSPRPAFGMGSFAPNVVDGKPVGPSFRYPEGTRELFAIFDYAGMTPQTHWGWRLSREGALLDEAHGLKWKEQVAGTFVLPLKVPGDAGIYDLDLFLNDKRQRIPSFIIGEPAPPQDRLRQADDFEDHQSYWGSAERTEGGAARFKNENGRAAIALLFPQGDGLAWKTSGESFDDVVVEVDATPLGEPDRNAYGVVFRYRDDGNFYAFLINPEGEFAILRVENGKQHWEKEWTRETPDVIPRGKNTNRVRVLVDGKLSRFYVNGRVVGGLSEARWRDGKGGILVMGRGKPGVQVGFDNWRVWSPPGKYALAPDKALWARFAFAKPGETTVAEAIRRVGEPYPSYNAYVLEDEIDVLGTRSADLHLLREVHERASARGVRVIKVEVLEWSVPERLRPIAKFAFRGDKLWYAMTVPPPAETTPEQLTARHGKEPRISTQSRLMADMIVSAKIYAYPELGIAYAQRYNDRIDVKLVFPPTEVNPFEPPAGFAGPDGRPRFGVATGAVADDGHLDAAAFEFVKPGVARAEVNKRLGDPRVSSPLVVAADRIDLFVDDAPTEDSNLQRAPQPTEDVHYYDYQPVKFPSEYARIVFRKDKVWYAMLPPRPTESSVEKAKSRYGEDFVSTKKHKKSGHILGVFNVHRIPAQGVGLVEVPGQGITHRLVFPPEKP